jgi:hypothetical protein
MSDFDNINISTETVIAKTNWKINLKELHSNLPITVYNEIPKKRGRRPKNEKKVEPQKLNDGEIITSIYCSDVRGVNLKSKKRKVEKEDDKKDNKKIKEEKDSYFRNSITIVMQCDNKLINFKISKNGKFQFTGCKTDEQAHKCLNYIKNYIYPLPNNRKILSLPLNTHLEVIYVTVMANINFSLGFCINKENLDEYINKNTDYYSLLLETTGYTGVNIKMPLSKMDHIPITKMTYITEKEDWEKEILSYKDYILLLDEKERNKEKEKCKSKYNTFLVFQSGNVILSSPHKECMRDTYHKFLSIINNCREQIEEKIQS